jgi:hypothetical protein
MSDMRKAWLIALCAVALLALAAWGGVVASRIGRDYTQRESARAAAEQQKRVAERARLKQLIKWERGAGLTADQAEEMRVLRQRDIERAYGPATQP